MRNSRPNCCLFIVCWRDWSRCRARWPRCEPEPTLRLSDGPFFVAPSTFDCAVTIPSKSAITSDNNNDYFECPLLYLVDMRLCGNSFPTSVQDNREGMSNRGDPSKIRVWS